MNAGFEVFGLTILAGIVLLRGLWGWCRWATLTPAALLAAGGILLGLFPGSGEAMADGTGDLHALGAFAGFLGGNLLAIMLGCLRRRVGFSCGAGRALISVGVIGLLSSASSSAARPNPFLVGLLCAGTSILHRPKGALLDATGGADRPRPGIPRQHFRQR
jgi:hypothetical protein